MAKKKGESKGRKIPIEAEGEEVLEEAVHAIEDAMHAVEDKQDTEASENELESALTHMKRLQAEFDNYRKRTDKERMETAAWAQGNLVQGLLPALDDMARAIEAAEAEGSALAEGFGLVRDKLTQELERAGLERIDVTDADFDPNLHEALLTEPVGEDQNGKVLQELVAGYTFSGRVIRPARVKVGVSE